MNISIESLFSNQIGIEYTWSNNGSEESEIEKMSKEDFAKILCEHSDGNYEMIEEMVYFEIGYMGYGSFVNSELDENPDYCKECLVKHIQSLNKN